MRNKIGSKLKGKEGMKQEWDLKLYKETTKADQQTIDKPRNHHMTRCRSNHLY
jgi:hypothetical protein